MDTMRVHVFQHVAFESIGSIALWLKSRGVAVTFTRFFEDYRLPATDAIDMMIVMGGPMSAHDEDRFTWLVPEKKLIREAVLRGIPVLGICLGAQLIADAMGARVYSNPVPEIGWLPVRAVPAAAGYFAFPKECLAFHWHGETFELPAGAVLLAESDACAHQAFQLNRGVIGLQFHLETTPESALALLENCRDDLVAGPYVQTEAELRAVPRSSYQAINKVMDRVLSYLAAGISRG
jgi:GMP synthase-like glutamine amidotransferase